MKTRGYIVSIVLVIVAIILLKVWFGFDLFKWLNSPEVKSFFAKIWEIISQIWDKFLREAFQTLFKLIKDIINR
ncbi:MAG: hypothetical protein AAB635_01305 [Patescibacteria group bacterium]